MKGKLYGVGVGPGDPMLMTLKAVKQIENCPVIAVPGKDKHQSVAYQIVSGVLDLGQKECLEIQMPMTKDKEKLDRCHEAGANQIEQVLQTGKDVAFLTLGDPTIYATYIYLHQRIAKRGYDTEIINGVPSFCAAAARLNIALAQKAQPLHVIPASYQVEEAMNLPGTKVFMKAGSKLEILKEKLINCPDDIYMVENCGMEQEKVFYSAEQMDEKAGYYSVVIMKEKDA